MQHVAHPLRPFAGEAHRLLQRCVRRDIALTSGERGREHVGGEDVDVPIAVDVGEVDGHAGIAGDAQRHLRRELKVALAVVEPELVRILEIVADIEIGRAIAVHIVEARRECEVIRIDSEWLATFVTKARTKHRLAREMSFPVIQKEQIGLGAL